MSNVASLLLDPRRNLIINGNMRRDQRNVSLVGDKRTFSSAAIATYVLDRWRWDDDSTAGTKTIWRELFTLGNALSDSVYYQRFEAASVGTPTIRRIAQRIPSVRTMAGRKVGVAFLVDGDSAYNINVSFVQNFGTGGSPSSPVQSSIKVVAVTTTMRRVELTFDIPGIGGKTIGTAGNDYLEFRIDLPLTTSIIFGLGDVTVTQDTPQLYRTASPNGQLGEDDLMQAFFTKTFSIETKPTQGSGTTFAGAAFILSQASAVGGVHWRFPRAMILGPTITRYAPGNGSGTDWRNGADSASVGSAAGDATQRSVNLTSSGSLAAADGWYLHVTAEAEL